MMQKTIDNDWQVIKNELWEKDEKYFQESRAGLKTSFNKTPGLKKIKSYSFKANKVLDAGCGDGTLLKLIWCKDRQFYGVDVSRLAIKTAKNQLRGKRNVSLKVANIENLPFKDNNFDLVYSAFVLEHINDSEKAITEMIRVTKKGGNLILLAPNFGCPHWNAPLPISDRKFLLRRAVKIFFRSHYQLVFKSNSLKWDKVHPLFIKNGQYHSDWDTYSEPYLGSLLNFLTLKDMTIVESSSGWSWPLEIFPQPGFSGFVFGFFRKAFKFLGRVGVAPYKFYGPVLFAIGRKK